MQFNYRNLTREGGALTNVAADLSAVTGNTATAPIDVNGNPNADSLVFAGTVVASTPTAQTFASTAVDVATDRISKTAHGLYTGLIGQFTTTGVLPTGLSLATDYYIIRLSANTFQVASSYANALAGTAINLTAQGSGDDTFTATTLANATMTVQGSFDYVQGVSPATWFDVPNTATALSGTADFNFEIDYLRYASYRLNFEVASGLINASPAQCGIRGGE